jgi:propanol-preferring alcohol dehydrogenase
MIACVLDQPGPVKSNPLQVRDVPLPELNRDEVLIRVSACGVCRTDLHVVEGELQTRKMPVIPGHQIVGFIEKTGPDVTAIKSGERVGVAWLHRTCGKCKYCLSGKENLCIAADFTGYTVDGGYADYAVAAGQFVYPIPEGFSDLQAAPLLCAGIIGFRALKLAGLNSGARLGLYGFGAAAHVVIQIARYRNMEVFACTRDEKHRRLALELGAAWAGDTYEKPPFPLDAAIIFAPAGEIVPAALRALDKGATLVLGGIHMSQIPPLNYDLLYQERVIRSVANNTREDGREFLEIAARIPIETHTQVFPLEEANQALNALKNDAIQGAAVLQNRECERPASRTA